MTDRPGPDKGPGLPGCQTQSRGIVGTMEDQIRRIVREEIARAFSAAGEVADNAMGATGQPVDVARGVVSSVMERVARDVLANVHPALEPEHTECTPNAPFVHVVTAVPERPKATCTCHRHTHVMGQDDRCGAAFCYCLTPVRAQPEHTSTEAPRMCSVCEHGEHDQGKCTMHVYLRGVASPCPCLASRTLGAQPSTGSRLMCTVCEHARHGAGQCRYAVPGGACTCSGVRPEPSTPPCSYCNHDHGGPLEDCPASWGGLDSKQQCPCPFTGGRP